MYKVYTLPNCTYCEQAKSLLQLKQLPYETYQIGVDIDREQILSQAPGIRTAPIIFEDDALIGTYHDLKTLLE